MSDQSPPVATPVASHVRILVVDDHPVLRHGLRQLIETDPRLRVIGEAGDGEAALALIDAHQPDVVVLDVDLPKLDGFGVLRELEARRLTPAIIFLTLHASDEMFTDAMERGVRGYILKESALAGIVEGIHAVAAGHYYVTPALTGLLVAHRNRARDFAARAPGLDALTPTERRVLQLVGRGLSSKEIAAQLFVHYRTVENHRVNIAQKLNLEGHNAVLKFALRHRHEL